MNKIQSECDHDWEIFESDRVKQCTYPECQLERELTHQDYEDLNLTSQDIDQQEGREFNP